MRAAAALLCLLVLAPALAGCAQDDADPDPAPAPQAEGARVRASGLPPPMVPQTDPGGALLDPLAPGPLATLRADYEFGIMLAQAPNSAPPQYPVAVRGELTVPDGPGPYPLVLLMHGRHGTCDVAGFEVLGAYACPNAVVVTPVDSHLGYRPLADLLASHGYLVASIDANDINERDQAPVSQSLVGNGPDYGAMARGELALLTARHLLQANATGSAGNPEQEMPLLQGRIDGSRIGLMGHSRGGEGMARAVVLNAGSADPLPLRALFALAPTDFSRWTPTGVAFATLLPYCDGDVSSLHGSWMYDDLRSADGAGALHQVLSIGANHNFYNDRWTGDDWGERDDPWCDLADGAGRDDDAVQMAQGAAVMSSFLRMEVGGEAGFDAYWTGKVPFPDAACDGACSARLTVSRHAAEARRLVLSDDGLDGQASGALQVVGCDPAQAGDCRAGSIGRAERANVTWSGAAALRFPVAGGLPSADAATVRLAVHHAADAAVTVRVLAEDGTPLLEWPVPAQRLQAPPGDAAAKLVLDQVRVPLPAGIAGQVAAVELAFAGSGEAQLADVLLQDEAP